MKRLAIPLLASSALASPTFADKLMDAAVEMFKPLPSAVPAVNDNPITDEKISWARSGISRSACRSCPRASWAKRFPTPQPAAEVIVP